MLAEVSQIGRWSLDERSSAASYANDSSASSISASGANRPCTFATAKAAAYMATVSDAPEGHLREPKPLGTGL